MDDRRMTDDELERLIEDYNSKRTEEQLAQTAPPTPKAAPKSARKRRGEHKSSDELSRQRIRRNRVSSGDKGEKRMTTAVSNVRKDLPEELSRRPAVRRETNKAIPPLPVNKRISPERLREQQIIDNILISLNERDDAPEDIPPLAGFRRIEDTKHFDPVSESKKAAKKKPADTDGETRVMKIPAEKPAEKEEPTEELSELEAAEQDKPAAEEPKPKKRPKPPVKSEPQEQSAEPEPEDGNGSETDSGQSEKEREIERISRKTAIANVAVCLTLIFGIGTALVVMPRSSGFIHSENRMLAEKPKLTADNIIDGSYFTDLSEWYTDTIPVREQLKPMSSNFSNLFGVTLDDVKIKGDASPIAVKETLASTVTSETTAVTLNTDFNTTTSAPEASATETTTTKKKKKQTEKVKEVDANVNGEWMGSVVVAGKGKNVRAMSAFYGTFEMGEKYAEVVNKYKADLDSKVNVYTLNMPNSAAYYMPDNLADQFTSQHDCITNIGNNLQGVMNIDVYDALEAHKDEYIYSRTDHHWQPLGAYYAAQVFAQKAMFDCPDISTYDEYKLKNFVGTMYAYSDYDEEISKNPDTLIYHKPDNNDKLTVTYYDSYFTNPQYGGSLFFDYAEGVNCYSAILGTDDEIAEIETDVNNGRTLVIIKDSYGNALVPYLTHGFERIYVCDFRFLDVNAIDFMERVGATDLLFAVSLQAAHTETNIVLINNDRIQEGSQITVTTTSEYQFQTPDTETETEVQTIVPTEDYDGDTGENYGNDNGYNEGW